MQIKPAEWVNRHKTFSNAVIAALFFFLLFVVTSYKMADDLGFDFAGYAQRYHFAFSGWVKNLLNGLPSDIFSPQLPSILPIFLRFLGFGSFTLPVASSILMFRILFALTFVFMAKAFGLPKKLGLIAGLFFVLNPIIYNFLDRYYELASWTFFSVWLVSFYLYLNEKKFSQKYFLASSVFASLAVLSSQTAAFFIPIAALFFLSSKEDIKRTFFTGLLAVGLCAFWLFPFIAYYGLSNISETQGSLLQTAGIFFSSLFLVIVLLASSFYALKNKGFDKRILRLVLLATALAVLGFLFPHAPIINKPFIHSYHVFFLLVVFFAWFSVIKDIKIDRKIAFAAIAVLALVFLVGHTRIIGQYANPTPTFSDYKVDGKELDFSKIDYFLKKIPHDAKYEVFPYDPVVSSYSSIKYGLTNLLGWGFNAAALKNSVDPDMKFFPEYIDCADLAVLEKTFGLSHVISLNKKAHDRLSECGFKKIGQNAEVALFSSPSFFGKSLLVENGELLEYENNYVKILARPPHATIKMNHFPLWKAFSGGKEIPIKDKKPGMEISVEKWQIVEFRFGPTVLEIISYFVTIISIVFASFQLIRPLNQK